MSLDAAIKILEAEITELGQGSTAQPREGTTEWFLLRARAAGLSMLRDMQRRGLEGAPRMAERFYRNQLKDMKAQEPPSA